MGRAVTEAIGWLSSILLFVTISYQVLRQWRSGTSRGVSRWLFVGQLGASTGFLIYSWLIESWVFVVTNLLMMASAIAGLAIVALHRRREDHGSNPSPRGGDTRRTRRARGGTPHASPR